MENKQIKCVKGESCLHCGSNYCRFVDELDQLKTENEELKKEIAFGNNGTLSDKIRAIVFKDLNKEDNKLSKTLTEIKEIAEEVYNDCDACYGDSDTNCDVDCIDCTLGGKAKLAEQILKKISECEVE